LVAFPRLVAIILALASALLSKSAQLTEHVLVPSPHTLLAPVMSERERVE